LLLCFGPLDVNGRYSAADNLLIAQARAAGKPSVRVSDVTLPTGKVLEFEVRFGSHAVSRRFTKPPQTMMVQVNLGSDNTRVVQQLLIGASAASSTGPTLSSVRSSSASSLAALPTPPPFMLTAPAPAVVPNPAAGPPTGPVPVPVPVFAHVCPDGAELP